MRQGYFVILFEHQEYWKYLISFTLPKLILFYLTSYLQIFATDKALRFNI